eukprot:TRINITY_DN1937_c0_g1_i2.p1 TRINITY_DN1937_c0_g1~~TRINITY_DN1937_c0_g1_i2.p1  ORF type:complete len:209 (-),score=23.58 TRINITY_DN1937_c0_g1_i2:774-1337(-)
MAAEVEFEIYQDTLLGKGSQSEVKLARDLTNNSYVAVKILDLKSKRRFFENERKALTKIRQHKNVLPILQSGDDGTHGYIFTQYKSSNITLLDYILENGHLSEEEALHILDQLVDGVSHIHRSNISHHDLKPENVLIDPSTKVVQIFDFGLSLELGRNGMVEDMSGSPCYMSPEVSEYRVLRKNCSI